ncbi:hypothetical protein GCM10011416_16170 [Polaribacter pacificus]|uniref:Lipoprotein n=1 Tax=Polaribacter pacificus TaxID=1775173 RepID=A0A917MG15_9FLAO|nr:hypothetical protein [Polaribacter pacificus]GGG98705.1 hypothetical protein GCM10011416_16170 [Polaribacter pacificus]
MKRIHTLLLGLTVLLASCTEKPLEDPQLSKVLEELKVAGQFEQVRYEFPGTSSKKIQQQKLLKVIFTNTSQEDFDEEKFGQKAAQKIYQLNSDTKKLETIWIALSGSKKSKRITVGDTPVDVKLSGRNLMYQTASFK